MVHGMSMNQPTFVNQFYPKQQFYPYPVEHQMTGMPLQPFPVACHGMPMGSMNPQFYYPMHKQSGVPQYMARPAQISQNIDSYVPLRMDDIGSRLIGKPNYESTNQIKVQPIPVNPYKNSRSDNDLFIVKPTMRPSGGQNYSMHHGAPGLMKQPLGKEASGEGKAGRPKQFSSPITKMASQRSQKQYSGLSDSSLAAAGSQPTKMLSASLRDITETAETKSNEEIAASHNKSEQNQQKSAPNAKNDSSKKAKRKANKAEKRKRERLSGKLKFFDEGKNYGFLVLDSDDSDMFVHYDDLKKTFISKDLLVSSKNRYSIHFTFHVFEYDGKYKSSKKAVDIKLVSIYKIDPIEETEISKPVFCSKNLAPNTEITELTLSNFFNS